MRIEERFSTLNSAKAAPVVAPASTIRAAPAPILRFQDSDTIWNFSATHPEAYTQSSPAIPTAPSAFLAEANILDIIGNNHRITTIVANLPQATLLVKDSSIIVGHMNVVDTSAETRRTEKETALGVIADVGMFQHMEIVSLHVDTTRTTGVQWIIQFSLSTMRMRSGCSVWIAGAVP